MATPTSGSILPPRTPLISARSAAALAVAVVVALVATTAGLAGLTVLVRRPGWWPGLTAAIVVSVLASAASIAPLVWGLRHSLYAALVGYFVAMGLRAAVSLGGCLLAVYVGGYPQAPTFLLMVVFYFVVLSVETTWVARATWSAKT